MNTLNLATDKDGFLLHLDDWSEAAAEELARTEGISILTAEHWELIHLIRNFHSEFDLSPAMRPLVKYVKTHLGQEKGNSIYLMKLFPQSPAKLLAKIAGLPRPENCL